MGWQTFLGMPLLSGSTEPEEREIRGTMHRQNLKFKIFVRFVVMSVKTLRVETLEKNRLCLQRYDLSCAPWSTLIRVTWCRQQYCRQKREERNIMPSEACHICQED